MRGLDQNRRSLLNLTGRMVDLFKFLRQPVVQHRKPGRMVDRTSLSAVRVQRSKQHGDGLLSVCLSAAPQVQPYCRVLTVCDPVKS